MSFEDMAKTPFRNGNLFKTVLAGLLVAAVVSAWEVKGEFESLKTTMRSVASTVKDNRDDIEAQGKELTGLSTEIDNLKARLDRQRRPPTIPRGVR